MVIESAASPLPALRTSRVYLREHRLSDLEAMRAIWADPQVTRYMTCGVMTDESIRATLRQAVAEAGARRRGGYRLAACLAGDDTVVATVRLDVENASTGFVSGFAASPNARGTGWATESLWLVLKLAFDHLDLLRCWAWVHNDNLSAQRTFELFGVTFTGERDWYLPGHGYTARGRTVEMTAAAWRALPADPTPRRLIAHRRRRSTAQLQRDLSETATF
ncbi:GNAT family N-acetyltransferase [Spirillospora sp. NPDC050679]